MNPVNSLEQLAHKLYDEYCHTVGGKAFNGEDLPKAKQFFADESKQKQADGWRSVAKLAYKYLRQ